MKKLVLIFAVSFVFIACKKSAIEQPELNFKLDKAKGDSLFAERFINNQIMDKHILTP